jgi:transposase-like protein
MSDSKRRHFTPEQKAQVVRRHLSGKEPVSALAEVLGVQPSQILAWVNPVLAQAEKAFDKSSHNGRERTEKAMDHRIEQLLAKIADKNEVIAELMEANVRAKKAIGEL